MSKGSLVVAPLVYQNTSGCTISCGGAGSEGQGGMGASQRVLQPSPHSEMRQQELGPEVLFASQQPQAEEGAHRWQQPLTDQLQQQPPDAHLREDARHAEHGPAAVHALALREPSQALLVGAQAQGVEAVCGQKGWRCMQHLDGDAGQAGRMQRAVKRPPAAEPQRGK